MKRDRIDIGVIGEEGSEGDGDGSAIAKGCETSVIIANRGIVDWRNVEIDSGCGDFKGVGNGVGEGATTIVVGCRSVDEGSIGVDEKGTSCWIGVIDKAKG